MLFTDIIGTCCESHKKQKYAPNLSVPFTAQIFIKLTVAQWLGGLLCPVLSTLVEYVESNWQVFLYGPE
jgi:hypothetical protein